MKKIVINQPSYTVSEKASIQLSGITQIRNSYIFFEFLFVFHHAIGHTWLHTLQFSFKQKHVFKVRHMTKLSEKHTDD